MTQSSRRSGFSNSWSSEPLFTQTLPVRIKPSDREEFSANLTLKVCLSQSSDSRSATPAAPSLSFELTDSSDPFFLYALRVSEPDFHCLKTDQRLLVDFQAFPSMVQKLLNECGSAAPMTASLSLEDTETASLSIVEANQFRELTHFSLRLRRGNDEAVKQYLASRLTHFKTFSVSLEEKLRITEEELRRTQHGKEQISVSHTALQNELETALSSANSAKDREIADLKEGHARELRGMLESSQAERAQESRQLREAVRLAEVRASCAEKNAEELKAQNLTLETDLTNSRKRVDQTENECNALSKSLDEARKESRILDTERHKLEKRIAELTVEVSGLRDNLESKGKLASNAAEMSEQLQSQKRLVEETVNGLRSQLANAEAKIAELNESLSKSHKTVETLETSVRTQKGKMKLKVSALHQQEALIVELEKKQSDNLRDITILRDALDKEKDASHRTRTDLENQLNKLNEAHNLLQSNEQVIAYLNKQLTDREVRTFSSTPNSLALQMGPKLKTRPVLLATTPVIKQVPDFPLRSAAPSLMTESDSGFHSADVSRVAPVSFAPRSTRNQDLH